MLTFIAVASVPACIKPPATRFEVPVPYQLPAQLPPGVERLPLKVGIYYSPEFENYEHFDRTFGESGIATPVGYFSIRQFNAMLFAMFQRSESVDRRPPYAAGDPASKIQLIIEPRIGRFESDITTFSMGPLTTQIDYRFKLYLPDGTTLATWSISASDTGKKSGSDSGVEFYSARTEAVVRKASIQFMQEFSDSPEVKQWLAEVAGGTGTGQLAATDDTPDMQAGKPMAKPPDTAFDVNAGALASGAAAMPADTTLSGVDINASLHRQVGVNQLPIQLSSVKSEVLSVQLTIKNNRAEPIVFDPNNLRLRTNRHTTLTPDSAQAVARRMLGDAGADNAAVNQFLLGGIFGALATMSEADAKDVVIKTTTDQLSRAQLDNQTIASNQSVSGVAYFIALGVDGELDRPQLRVGIADPTHRKDYETSLDMTSGAATAGTLLLAGLKQPEDVASGPEEFAATLAALKASFERGELSGEEYMQKQREVVNEYTGNTSVGLSVRGAPTAGMPLRVGILPPGLLNPSWSSSHAAEQEIYSEIRRFIRSKPSFTVSVDYAARYEAELSDSYAVWQGGVVRKVPDKAKMQVIGEKLEVDILVLAWIATSIMGWQFDLYVFDVASGKMYQSSDNSTRTKGLVASTFGPIERQQARQRDGTSTATRGTLLLAETRPPESPTGTMEKTAATVTVQTQSRRQLLNPTELRVQLTGNTFTGQTNKGIKFHVYHRADGTMYGIVLSGRSKGKRDDGIWNVVDEIGYCRQWAQWAGAAEDCFNVFRYGESVIFEQNSGYEGRKSTGLIRTGNPENL